MSAALRLLALLALAIALHAGAVRLGLPNESVPALVCAGVVAWALAAFRGAVERKRLRAAAMARSHVVPPPEAPASLDVVLRRYGVESVVAVVNAEPGLGEAPMLEEGAIPSPASVAGVGLRLQRDKARGTTAYAIVGPDDVERGVGVVLDAVRAANTQGVGPLRALFERVRSHKALRLGPRRPCELAGVVVRVRDLGHMQRAIDDVARACEVRGARMHVGAALETLSAEELRALTQRGWAGDRPARLSQITPANIVAALASVPEECVLDDEVVQAEREVVYVNARLQGAQLAWADIKDRAHTNHPWFVVGDRTFLCDPALAPAPGVAQAGFTLGDVLPSTPCTSWRDGGGHSSPAGAARLVAALLLVLASAALFDAVNAAVEVAAVRRRVAHAMPWLRGDDGAQARGFGYLGDAARRLARLRASGVAGFVVAHAGFNGLREPFGGGFLSRVIEPIAADLRQRVDACATGDVVSTSECADAVTFVRLVASLDGLGSETRDAATRIVADIIADRWRTRLAERGFPVPPRAVRWRAAFEWFRNYGSEPGLRPHVAALDVERAARAVNLDGFLDARLDAIEARVSVRHRDELLRALQERSSAFEADVLPASQYTATAWRDEVAAAIEAEAHGLASQPWLLEPLAREHMGEADLASRLVVRYFDRYERAWRNALASMRLRPTATESAMLGLVDALVDPVLSPYERLLCMIDGESRPGEARESASQRSVLSTATELLWPARRGTQPVVPPAVASRLRDAFASPVALAFSTRSEAPCSLAMPHPDPASRLRRHLNALGEVRAGWRRAEQEGTATQFRARILDARGALRVSAGQGPGTEEFVHLLEEPLDRMEGAFTRRRARSAAQRYCDTVYEPIVRERGYPFSRDPTRVGVPLDTLRQIFAGAHGLPGLVDEEFGGALALGRTATMFERPFLSFVASAEPLQSAFSGQWTFAVSIRAWPQVAVRVELRLGDETASCLPDGLGRMQCEAVRSLRWPAEHAEASVLIWSDETASPCGETHEDGEFAIWRMFERASRRWTDDSRTFLATIPTACGPVSLAVRPSETARRLISDDPTVTLFAPLRQLRVPSRIMPDAPACGVALAVAR